MMFRDVAPELLAAEPCLNAPLDPRFLPANWCPWDPDGRPLGAAAVRVIKQKIGQRHGVTVAAIDGPRRFRQLVLARQEAMYHTARLLPHFSYPIIGRYFGLRDHTTVIHGARAHAARTGLPQLRRS